DVVRTTRVDSVNGGASGYFLCAHRASFGDTRGGFGSRSGLGARRRKICPLSLSVAGLPTMLISESVEEQIVADPHFVEAPATPVEHFKLYFYAAVVRVIGE